MGKEVESGFHGREKAPELLSLTIAATWLRRRVAEPSLLEPDIVSMSQIFVS